MFEQQEYHNTNSPQADQISKQLLNRLNESKNDFEEVEQMIKHIPSEKKIKKKKKSDSITMMP